MRVALLLFEEIRMSLISTIQLGCSRLQGTKITAENRTNCETRHHESMNQQRRLYVLLLSLSVWLVSLMAIPASAQLFDTKRGMAGSQDQRENAMNVRWAYNWGNEPNHNVAAANFEFVPMIWSASPGGVGGQIDRIFNLETNFGVEVEYVLGFNEPERQNQANMSVQTALDTWAVMTERFAGTGIKLVSPAVSGSLGVNEWLRPFMDAVEARNADADPTNDLQVDEVALHWYSTGGNPISQANNILNMIDNLWNDYGRPIWLTEFAGVDFSGNAATAERVQFNQDFLDYIIPRLESRDHVARYSWWQFGIGGNPYSQLSSLNNGVYTPTGIGDRYQGTLQAGETYDLSSGVRRPTDVHYLREATLTNTGVPTEMALRAVEALEGNCSITGSADYGFEDAPDAFVRIRAGAVLRKEGVNTITLSDSPLFNEGNLLVQGGTLRFEDGVRLSGEGTMRIDANGVLATSHGTEGDEIALDSRIIILNQGLLHVEDGRAEITQQLRFWNPSEVRTDGDLLISGFVGGGGRILSTGTGALFLSGAGEHANGATVSEGNLVVANTEFSATGVGNVLVNGTGTFGGFGLVDGNVQVDAGATVAPGVFQSSYGTTFVPTFDEGVVVDGINFDFSGIQDDAPLTQTSLLDGGLQLISGFDFGPGIRPRNAANNGNEFNVAGFSTGDNFGTAINDGDFLTFTVAPVDGLAMTIDEVSFELRRNGGGAAQRYVLGTSIAGFTYAERWGEIALVSTDTTTHAFTASNPSLEALTDEVEIRLVGLESGNDAGNTHFYNVSLDASFTSDPNSVAFDPIGILELGGDYTQLDFATLEIELGGYSNIDPMNAEYDQLLVAGDVQLDGTLDLSFVEDYMPSVGDTFDVITAGSISGSFSTINVPDDMNLAVNYFSTFVQVEFIGETFLLGDVNCDGSVDLLDVGPFVDLITSGQYEEKGDINQDGAVDLLDVGPFVGLLQG